MDVTTLTMQPNVARRMYLEYKEAVKSHQRKRRIGKERQAREDTMLMRTYQKLAQGKRVINLFDVMRETGTDYEWRPKLAIARADTEGRVFYRKTRAEKGWGWRPTFCSGDAHTSDKTKRIQLPAGIFQHIPADISALVPQVPPNKRPASGNLTGYHILWEAKWDSPPIDPFLLKRIDGPFFAIISAWDLTELEQSLVGIREMLD